jgi:tryptophanase
MLVSSDSIVPNNTHFDTTRANIEFMGGKPLDLPCKEADEIESTFPFKGNMDTVALEQLVEAEGPERIPVIMVTVTNINGQHP